MLGAGVDFSFSQISDLKIITKCLSIFYLPISCLNSHNKGTTVPK